MNELERRLVDLGRELEFPPVPDLAPRVRARLTGRRGRRRRLVVALALLSAVVAGALAVPQARSALWRLLQLDGVTIERVPELPTVTVSTPFFLGERVSIGDARERVGFRLREPHLRGLGAPDAVYVRDDRHGGVVTMLWGAPLRPRLLLTQFDAEPAVEPLFAKNVGEQTRVDRVTVRGERGYWIGGGVHVLLYRRPGEPDAIEENLYLARATLFWEDDDVTLRLEADIGKDAALRIAESVR